MTSIRKHVMTWSGFQGAPGYTVMYGADSDGLAADIRTFFDAIKTLLPSSVTVSWAGEGDVLEDTTGALTGGYVEAAPASVTGTGVGDFAAPAGFYVRWNTGVIVGGRRLRGRSFIVPCAEAIYGPDGTLATTQLATAQAAATALALDIDARLRVWHRPVNGAGGSSSFVTSATVPDKVAVLRSRRD